MKKAEARHHPLSTLITPARAAAYMGAISPLDNSSLFAAPIDGQPPGNNIIEELIIIEMAK